MAVSRSIIHGLVVEELSAGSWSPRPEILLEGLAEETARNALQAAVAGAAEYGLAATVAGAPAAPVAETAVDAAFAGGKIMSAVSTVKGVMGAGSELHSLFEAAQGALSGKFNSETLYLAVRRALTALGVSGGASLIEKVKQKAEDLLDRISGAISAAVKAVIPDAAIGAVVSQAITTAISTLAGNSYTLVTSALGQLGGLKDYLTVPGKAADFFKKALPQLVEMIRSLAGKIENTSNLTAALAGPTGLILKNVGPMGLRKIADMLEQKTPEIVEMMSSIVSVIMPAMLAAVAAIQSIIKGDYKQVSGDEKVTPKPAGAIAQASESINEVESMLLEMRVRRIRRSRHR